MKKLKITLYITENISGDVFHIGKNYNRNHVFKKQGYVLCMRGGGWPKKIKWGGG